MHLKKAKFKIKIMQTEKVIVAYAYLFFAILQQTLYNVVGWEEADQLPPRNVEWSSQGYSARQLAALHSTARLYSHSMGHWLQPESQTAAEGLAVGFSGRCQGNKGLKIVKYTNLFLLNYVATALYQT